MAALAIRTNQPQEVIMAIDEATKLAVWNKGKTVGTNDPKVYRKDECDAWMQFSKYGDRIKG